MIVLLMCLAAILFQALVPGRKISGVEKGRRKWEGMMEEDEKDYRWHTIQSDHSSSGSGLCVCVCVSNQTSALIHDWKKCDGRLQKTQHTLQIAL